MLPVLGLDLTHVLRLRSLLALLGFELDPVSLLEGAESAAGYGGEVYEDIFAAVIRGDEPKAFRVVEPLHCSLHADLTSGTSYLTDDIP